MFLGIHPKQHIILALLYGFSHIWHLIIKPCYETTTIPAYVLSFLHRYFQQRADSQKESHRYPGASQTTPATGC